MKQFKVNSKNTVYNVFADSEVEAVNKVKEVESKVEDANSCTDYSGGLGKLVETSPYEIPVFKKRSIYSVYCYNRDELDYTDLDKLSSQFGVRIRKIDYGNVIIESENKEAIYKVFSKINPNVKYGSWKILDEASTTDGSREVEQEVK